MRTMKKWSRRLKTYGITERDFDISKVELTKKFGEEPSDKDVIWSLFNKLITKMRDFHTLKMIYYDMALFLNEEGKDFFSVLQQSAKMELMYYKQSDVEKVQILTAGKGSCEQCQQSENKIFTIEEAFEKMPIPSKECTHEMSVGQRGFCKCCYIAKID